MWYISEADNSLLQLVNVRTLRVDMAWDGRMGEYSWHRVGIEPLSQDGDDLFVSVPLDGYVPEGQGGAVVSGDSRL